MSDTADLEGIWQRFLKSGLAGYVSFAVVATGVFATGLVMRDLHIAKIGAVASACGLTSLAVRLIDKWFTKVRVNSSR